MDGGCFTLQFKITYVPCLDAYCILVLVSLLFPPPDQGLPQEKIRAKVNIFLFGLVNFVSDAIQKSQQIKGTSWTIKWRGEVTNMPSSPYS